MTFKQAEIDFSDRHKENSPANMQHYEANKDRFNAQCNKVLELLSSGIKLNSFDAVSKYKIGDLRRRIKDLRDAGIKVLDEWMMDSEGKKTRFKNYFIQ